MERGQEDLTEWNLSEGVELGCEVWLLCKGDHLRWGRREICRWSKKSFEEHGYLRNDT